MSWRSRLEDKFTIACEACGHESLAVDKEPNQKYLKKKCTSCGFDPANPDPFINFGAIARDKLLMQCQYASRYLTDDFEGYPNFSEGIRIQGDRADYHSIKIHKDDVMKFVVRVCRHMSKTSFTDRAKRALDLHNRN